MKHASDRLINRLDTAEERISELENTSIDNSKSEMQKTNKQKNGTDYPRIVEWL